MHRFYQPSEAFAGNYINSSDKKLISQLSNVLRAKEGEKFLFFDGSGEEYLSQLIELQNNFVKLLIIDKKKGEAELEKEIVLYPSLLKADKFEWMLQKVTELGVTKIVPVVSKRCIIDTISQAKFNRYGEIIKEATEQCGGCIIPSLQEPVVFESAVQIAANDNGCGFIAWEQEEEEQIPTSLRCDRVHFFIGPEGGYSKEEVDYALKNKIKAVSLGKRILRAETASIYALSILQNYN